MVVFLGLAHRFSIIPFDTSDNFVIFSNYPIFKGVSFFKTLVFGFRSWHLQNSFLSARTQPGASLSLWNLSWKITVHHFLLQSSIFGLLWVGPKIWRVSSSSCRRHTWWLLICLYLRILIRFEYLLFVGSNRVALILEGSSRSDDLLLNAPFKGFLVLIYPTSSSNYTWRTADPLLLPFDNLVIFCAQKHLTLPFLLFLIILGNLKVRIVITRPVNTISLASDRLRSARKILLKTSILLHSHSFDLFFLLRGDVWILIQIFCHFGLILGSYHAVAKNLGGIFLIFLPLRWHYQDLILVVSSVGGISSRLWQSTLFLAGRKVSSKIGRLWLNSLILRTATQLNCLNLRALSQRYLILSTLIFSTRCFFGLVDFEWFCRTGWRVVLV